MVSLIFHRSCSIIQIYHVNKEKINISRLSWIVARIFHLDFEDNMNTNTKIEIKLPLSDIITKNWRFPWIIEGRNKTFCSNICLIQYFGFVFQSKFLNMDAFGFVLIFCVFNTYAIVIEETNLIDIFFVCVCSLTGPSSI